MRIALVLIVLVACGGPSKPAPEPIHEETVEDDPPSDDQDGDRVRDVDDVCIADPEVFNGYEDEDGCPDRSDERMLVTETTIEVIEVVYFESGKVDLSSTGLAILDEIAAVLDTNPQILKIEVQGHADDVEQKTPEQRLALSDARAVAVADYLVKQGVARDRLEVASYGDVMPRDPAGTKEARATNRRVEFLVLKTADD